MGVKRPHHDHRERAHDEDQRGKHQQPRRLGDPEHVHGRQQHEADQRDEQEVVGQPRERTARLAAPAARLTATVST